MADAVPTGVWIATIGGLVAIVVLDLVVIARRRREVTMKDATLWVGFYVGLALAFAVGMFVFAGGQAGGEFLAGYITEYSLSVDNLFVFLIIMSKFGVPRIAQDKVLYIGIVLSMLLRAVCIVAGSAALQTFNWVFYLFGALLLYTAVKLVREGDEEAEYQDNVVVRAVGRLLPSTPYYNGTRFTQVAAGRRLVTPLVSVVTAIMIANVVFALDSIPAIFGLTQNAYIVLTANAFALMGLRQLYFLIGGLLERLVYLNYGLAIILGFIGVKLVVEALHGDHLDHIGDFALPHIGIATSLSFIVVTLTVTTVLSLLRQRAQPASASEEEPSLDRATNER
jgi:TerC family integral membrane protein